MVSGLVGGGGAEGQSFGGGGLQLAPAPAPVTGAFGMGASNYTFNVIVNAGGADAAAVQQAARFGVLDAARALGVL